MTTRRRRFVLVTRPTSLELLLARHGTLGQARFALDMLGQELAPHERAHALQHEALAGVQARLEADRRRTHVSRDELERFLFAPDDLVVLVGQDGLVANAAKYLEGQPAFGVNPDPDTYDGVLCRHRPEDVKRLLEWDLGGTHHGLRMQARTMAQALREDGQRLLALNEIFVGHRTHQSARYLLHADDREERQSSSGLLCGTGTGATGWLRSVTTQRGFEEILEGPDDPRLAWFVREPFPSVATGTSLDHGLLAAGDALEVRSEMPDGGVVFADGIETDRLEFAPGHVVRLSRADRALNLLVPVKERSRGRRKRGGD